eukprot:gb/GECH01007397.1/.p1 GENE.gb/GECH01007397.1/~~gb/GECH01007397.1/.p1  ORF type:complete len:152 (+),score=41.21 gb/GECH01007397.1/:1-456(+)
MIMKKFQELERFQEENEAQNELNTEQAAEMFRRTSYFSVEQMTSPDLQDDLYNDALFALDDGDFESEDSDYEDVNDEDFFADTRSSSSRNRRRNRRSGRSGASGSISGRRAMQVVDEFGHSFVVRRKAKYVHSVLLEDSYLIYLVCDIHVL